MLEYLKGYYNQFAGVIFVNCLWLPQAFLLLIDRPEGERLLLCTEHMQWPILTGRTGHMAASTASLQEAHRTYPHGNFHPYSAEYTKVWISHSKQEGMLFNQQSDFREQYPATDFGCLWKFISILWQNLKSSLTRSHFGSWVCCCLSLSNICFT